MAKSTTPYWNTLSSGSRERWTPVKGLEGMAEELTLSIDDGTGEYTRLTRFLPGADTPRFGGKTHLYPEEVLVVTGRLCGNHASTLVHWPNASDGVQWSILPGRLEGIP